MHKERPYRGKKKRERVPDAFNPFMDKLAEEENPKEERMSIKHKPKHKPEIPKKEIIDRFMQLMPDAIKLAKVKVELAMRVHSIRKFMNEEDKASLPKKLMAAFGLELYNTYKPKDDQDMAHVDQIYSSWHAENEYVSRKVKLRKVESMIAAKQKEIAHLNDDVFDRVKTKPARDAVALQVGKLVNDINTLERLKRRIPNS